MRRLAVLLAVLAVLAAGGAVATRIGRHSTSSPAATPSDATQRSATTAGAQNEIQAARVAAVAAVSLTDEVARAGFISRRELIESFTTPAYGPKLADETSSAVNAMLLELGQRQTDPSALYVVEQPITARAEANGNGVRVEVWSVLVVAVPGTGPGRQVWRTVTLDMVKVGGRWLVGRWVSTPGPTPSPSAEGAFDDARAFVEPIGWPAATSSVVK